MVSIIDADEMLGDKIDFLATSALLLEKLSKPKPSLNIYSTPTDQSSFLDTLAELASGKLPIMNSKKTLTSDANISPHPPIEPIHQRRPRAQSEPWISDNRWASRVDITPRSPIEQTILLPNISEKYADIYNKNGRIGIYTREERDIIIHRYHEKRRRRVWKKKIRYHCRKNLADRRERVKGRFVKLIKEEDVGASGGRENGGTESSSHVRLDMLLKASEVDDEHNMEVEVEVGDMNHGNDVIDEEDTDEVDMDDVRDKLILPKKGAGTGTGTGLMRKNSPMSSSAATATATVTTGTKKNSLFSVDNTDVYDDAALLSRLSDPILNTSPDNALLFIPPTKKLKDITTRKSTLLSDLTCWSNQTKPSTVSEATIKYYLHLSLPHHNYCQPLGGVDGSQR
eukprot:gene10271-21430_t